jgi:hypothetical protein
MKKRKQLMIFLKIDNVEKFTKMNKKVLYNDKRSWKDYFKNKGVKNLNNLTQVLDSLEKWLK